ncbi:hypothetical protein B0H16DRAFT_1540039, partial [Mycena metata]
MPTIDLRRRLVELDAQILEQKRVLHSLQQTRIAVERELRETATYPILTLPVEVTIEIFHRLPLEVGDKMGIRRNAAPISLTTVCRSWRAIALSTPTLWSTLKISFDDIPFTVIAKPGLVESFINQWLGRSGECPLSLTFSLPQLEIDSLYNQVDFSISRLRPIIHQYAHRVRYIELDFKEDTRISELELHSSPFPLLQVANVCCDFDIETRVFSNAPLLHSLHLGGEEGVIVTRFHLPWQQLTTFEGFIDNLDLFIVAPNLIDVKCYWSGRESTLGVITHSRITSFTIIRDCDILQYLTFPSLQHLDVYPLVTYDFFESFLKRSCPPLISLGADAAGQGFAQWHKALVHVAATLENIKISYVPHEVMTSLLSLEERPWLSPPWRTLNLLPNLKTLHLSPVYGPVDQFYELVRFLYARSDKLRSFQLEWFTTPFLDAWIGAGAPGAHEKADTITGHFSRLQTAGMDIYVGTPNRNYAAKTHDAADV